MCLWTHKTLLIYQAMAGHKNCLLKMVCIVPNQQCLWLFFFSSLKIRCIGTISHTVEHNYLIFPLGCGYSIILRRHSWAFYHRNLCAKCKAQFSIFLKEHLLYTKIGPYMIFSAVFSLHDCVLFFRAPLYWRIYLGKRLECSFKLFKHCWLSVFLFCFFLFLGRTKGCLFCQGFPCKENIQLDVLL